jgi:Concanavalin A-like lectin/glucanases superfamily
MSGQQDYLPSFKQGFARCAAESANPSLWTKLAGAWCPFLGVQGGFLFDAAGQNPPASLNNGDWIAASSGAAASFNGTTSYVNCGTGLILDPSKPWSILMVIRCDNFAKVGGVGRRVLISRMDANNAIQLVTDNDSVVNSFTFVVRKGGTEYRISTPHGADVVGKWHVVLATWNGIDTPHIYLAGVQSTYVTANSGYGVGTDSNLNIMRRTDGAGYVAGSLAMAAIWSRTIDDVAPYVSAMPYSMFRLRRRIYASASQGPPAARPFAAYRRVLASHYGVSP